MRVDKVKDVCFLAVEDVTGVSSEMLIEKGRQPHVAWARQLFMWAAYSLCPSSGQVGEWIGRDSGTVRHAYSVVEANNDPGGITKGWKKEVQGKVEEWLKKTA